MRSRTRVLVVEDRLSPHSGTSKIALSLIHGFQSIGCEVIPYFFSSAKDSAYLQAGEPIAVRDPSGNALTRLVSLAFQLPLIRTVWDGAFTTDDIVDVAGEFVDDEFLALARSADLVVFMNFWSAMPVIRLGSQGGPRTAVYFHEAPSFAELPPGFRGAVRSLIRRVTLRCNLVISPSFQISKSLERLLGLKSRVFYCGTTQETVPIDRDPRVLFDTRWTSEREPKIALEIARLVPDARFVMSGYFPSPSVRNGILADASTLGLAERFEVRDGLLESELSHLFATSRCYVRWSARSGEAGTSFGLFQAVSNLCPPVIDDGLGSADFLRSWGLDQLVVNRSAVAFAQQIHRLLVDDQYYSKVVSQLAGLRSIHSWSEYCKRLLSESGVVQ